MLAMLAVAVPHEEIGRMRASIAQRFGVRRTGVLPPVADCRGVTMLEYGLIAGLIALVCVAAISNIGPGLGSVFNDVDASLQSSV